MATTEPAPDARSTGLWWKVVRFAFWSWLGYVAYSRLLLPLLPEGAADRIYPIPVNGGDDRAAPATYALYLVMFGACCAAYVLVFRYLDRMEPRWAEGAFAYWVDRYFPSCRRVRGWLRRLAATVPGRQAHVIAPVFWGYELAWAIAIASNLEYLHWSGMNGSMLDWEAFSLWAGVTLVLLFLDAVRHRGPRWTLGLLVLSAIPVWIFVGVLIWSKCSPDAFRHWLPRL